jgi:hypothetical protein
VSERQPAILPCPFCGELPRIVGRDIECRSGTCVAAPSIRCEWHFCEEDGHCDDECCDDLVKRWNTRAPTPNWRASVMEFYVNRAKDEVAMAGLVEAVRREAAENPEMKAMLDGQQARIDEVRARLKSRKKKSGK